MKLKSDQQFKTLIESLWDELLRANTHFIVLMDLMKHGPEFIDEINFSPVFWRFTVASHGSSALAHLLRAYDQHPAGFHLPRLLEAVKENPSLFTPDAFLGRVGDTADKRELLCEIGSVSSTQLEEDLKLVRTTDPLVANITKWRNIVIAHKNPAHVLTKQSFEINNPLPYDDIETLIRRGFTILNRYSLFFDGSTYGETLHNTHDALFVLESLRHHPDSVKVREDDLLVKSTHQARS